MTVQRQVNLSPVLREIILNSIRALDDTLTYTQERAQYYAPVRAIFRGEHRPRQNQYPRAIAKIGSNTAQVMTTYRRHPLSTAAQYDLFKRSLAPTRRINLPKFESGGASAFTKEVDAASPLYNAQREKTRISLGAAIDVHGGGLSRGLGRANSEIPVVRVGDVTLSGDFRRFASPGKLASTAYFRSVKGGRAILKPPPDNGVSIAQAEFNIGGKKKSLLTSAGRAEVRSGRATSVAIKDKTHTARVGGTLKHSIVVIPPTQKGKRIIGYVRAGGLGVEYAAYQEFGTSHNRAHPYLRPALYESRKVFIAKVEQAFRRIGKSGGITHVRIGSDG